MLEAVLEEAQSADVIIKAAAVGDYKAASPSGQKMKRTGEKISLELAENPDILAELAKKRKDGQILVGFAAETQDIIDNASKKLAKKGADLIAVNDVNAPGCGFGSDRNEVTVLDAKGILSRISGSKEEVAELLWDLALERRARLP
jgi:phosphopantothenoylcysteine decarboxylase/phosphopantothenate--cysteine ligase